MNSPCESKFYIHRRLEWYSPCILRYKNFNFIKKSGIHYIRSIILSVSGGLTDKNWTNFHGSHIILWKIRLCVYYFLSRFHVKKIINNHVILLHSMLYIFHTLVSKQSIPKKSVYSSKHFKHVIKAFILPKDYLLLKRYLLSIYSFQKYLKLLFHISKLRYFIIIKSFWHVLQTKLWYFIIIKSNWNKVNWREIN